MTNKREAYARALLEQAGLAGRLAFVIGGDSVERKKPDPEGLERAGREYAVDRAECVVIGDSIYDREAARAAGIAFIFASYGYGRADDPALTDGLASITGFDELPALLCPPQTAK